MTDRLVPLLAIALGMGGWVVVVVAAIMFDYFSKKRRYEAVVKALELGKTPQEINEIIKIDKAKKRTGTGFLITAILLGALGLSLLGLGVITSPSPDNEVFSPALFALVFALAFAVIYYLVRAKAKKE